MIIVAGDLIIHPGDMEQLRPFMARMVAESRAEAGCLHYSYAVDILDDSIIRVNEAWSNQAALDAHLNTEHLKIWRESLARIGIVKRQLYSWPVTDGTVF